MSYLWIILLVSFAVSSIGWLYFIYFFSIGYGLSISALSVAAALIFKDTLTASTTAMCVILFLYGIRLAAFLLIREKKSETYKKILYQPSNRDTKPLSVMFMIWASCALLYVGQISPLIFLLSNATNGVAINEIWVLICVVVTALGVLIEAIADAQKSRAKKVNPNRFVDKGLYKIVRCPNYFGEIMIWSGCFMLCFGTISSPSEWIVAILGYAGILYVMFSGARRIEIRQKQQYGNDDEFKSYIKRTPIILPLVPIYSVEKYSWLKA